MLQRSWVRIPAKGRNMGYSPVRYDSRVVIYECKMFIRLATGLQIWISENRASISSFTTSEQPS